MKILLEIPPAVYASLTTHLLQDGSRLEEAAFVYANMESNDSALCFRYVDWLAVPLEGFEHRTAFYLELTDEMRARVIKRAHDLGACLIEFHSHTGPWPARFSPSDLEGFEEFVPHVWWRLKGKPYIAIVVTREDIDALAWVQDPHTPRILDGLVSGKQIISPTGLSLRSNDFNEDGTL